MEVHSGKPSVLKEDNLDSKTFGGLRPADILASTGLRLICVTLKPRLPAGQFFWTLAPPGMNVHEPAGLQLLDCLRGNLGIMHTHVKHKPGNGKCR